MAQSPEYPDLRWMPPKSWTDANRTAVQLIVIHTTEGSEGPTSAEDGAGYDQRRTDGTSTHFFHDADSTVQCVRTADQAHAARAQGNRRGIQHELCGRAGQGAAGWDDQVSQGTLRQAAKQCARDAKKWGIPVRRLTVAQVAAGDKGICGHVDITHAFPQDNGTHTDPGPNFPWSQFLDLVRAEMEDDVTPDELLGYDPGDGKGIPNPFADKGTNKTISPRTALYNAVLIPMRVEASLNTLAKVVAGLASGAATQADVDALKAMIDQVDENVAARLVGATPEATAAALKAVLGDQAAAVGRILAAA
jgi:hypothetical protein